MKKLALLLVFILLLMTSLLASSFKIISGNPGILKNEKLVNIEFRFDGRSIGKFNTEQEYIDYYVNDRNKKEPGRGEVWKQEWMTNSREFFPTLFTQEMNKITNTNGIQVEPKKPEAK